jgi:C-terminal processing protease CtpA/Prc
LAAAQDNPPGLAAEVVRQTVEVVGTTIRQEYFDPEVGARVDDSLQQRWAQGRYAGEKSLPALAARLTEDLFELTRDKHLAVTLVPAAVSTGTSPAQSDGDREVVGRRANFGVQRVEVLAGNVGYLNLTAFYRIEEARQVLSAAMQTVVHADALILDLRDNGGGSPDTVAWLASYFFDRPQEPLFEIVSRSGEAQTYATATCDLVRNEARPMFVLISARTFSGGEGMAFLLQERGRAEIIGETTAGAANPGRPYPVNDHFEVTVPNGRVRMAITGTNWEGSGVAPDVEAIAADALDVAHIHALRRLIEHAEPGTWRDTLERHLGLLQDRQAESMQ